MTSKLADALDALAQRLANAAQGVRSGNCSLFLETDTVSTTERMGHIKAAIDLINVVSLPKDKVRLFMPQFAHITAIRLFIKWKAFEKIPTGDGESILYTDLAASLGADVSLITRIARVLVANSTLKQVGADRVAHTPLSSMFTTPNPTWAMVQLQFDGQLPSLVALPKYFDHFGLAEPKDRLQTPVAFSQNRLGSTVWEIDKDIPGRLQITTLAMAGKEELMPPLGAYNLDWAVEEVYKDTERVLVVDVGGGKGQALKGILKATPGLPRNRCVLEDLPEVIEAAGQDAELAEVQMIGMNFHNEQPVNDALVYYMRRCLHDYHDEECVGMLRNIAGAMAADSRLLIVEMLLGERPDAFQAAMDLMMMTISGKERTRADFEDITGKAGLKITKVAQNPGGSAVIECALA